MKKVAKSKALILWFVERFPIPNFILGICVALKIGISNHIFSGTTESLEASLLCQAAVAVTSFFLLLRILDEHKDYALDSRTHPERVLQKGLVTLNDLKCFAVGTIFLQLAFSYINGIEVLSYWGLVLAWTYLMTMEFCCKEALSKRPLLYGISHMFVLILMALWIGCGFGSSPSMLLAVHLFMLSAAIEVTRKSFNKSENAVEGDSYSRVLGLEKSLKLAALLAVAATVLDGFSLWFVHASWGILAIVPLCALQLSSLYKYCKTQSAPQRKNAEKYLGIQYVLSTGITVIAYFL
jgi:4-hydroxybenzoate polyprenyltransferase